MALRVRIGLIAFGHGLGRTGGLQVYARDLADALRRHAPEAHRFTLLVHPEAEVPALPPGDRASAVRLRWPGGRPANLPRHDSLV